MMENEQEARALYHGHIGPLNPTCEKDWNRRAWKEVGWEIAAVLAFLGFVGWLGWVR